VLDELYTFAVTFEKNTFIMDNDKLSYALGMNVADSLVSQGLAVASTDDFASGLKAVVEGGDTAMTQEEALQVINEFMQAKSAKEHGANAEVGQKFLAENKTKEGIVELESGLQYEVITDGDGAKPGAADQVTTHYHGSLLNGTVFDSSVERGEPASFGVNQVIAGWTEALQLMNTGSKWRLFIPPNLAYGDRGAGQAIGPHATLIFEVELLSIN
jgi:FKBP-type peptidyl-prolyl cis-trans isomerase FklB